jgi:acyl carrier protein
MDKSKIFNILKEVAKKHNINISNNQLDTTLKSLGIDSLQGVNLIIEVEEKCHVTIPDPELIKIKTPNDIINVILKLQK